MVKKPRMGRNLDALLGSASTRRRQSEAQPDASPTSDDAATTPDKGPGNSASQAAATTDSSAKAGAAANDTPRLANGDRLKMLPVEKIRRGAYQPRRQFDQELLEELAESLKSEGMIQPIIVREFAGAYELVAGERRWRAAQLAGMSDVPAIIRSMEDQAVAAVSLIENIQRKDLNPLEEAEALSRLCDEFGMTHKAVAASIGRSRASVSNLMRLLELEDEVKLLVDRGELSFAQARTLLGAPRDKQRELAELAVKQGLSVRVLESRVRQINAEQSGETVTAIGQGSTAVQDPDIERLCKRLGEKLGASVNIQHRANGSGKLEISYTSNDELQGILAHIK